MRRALICLCLAFPALAAPGAVGFGQSAQAAAPAAHQGQRLLMVERRGCIWCERWDAEIAPGYAASPEGGAAPLVRVDLDGPWPDGIAIAARPRVTPTFILLQDGQEQGRIEGYPGATYFFPVLREVMRGSSPKDRP